jgi:glycosyltransferase involved in cell wall biosynthesis
MRILHIGKFFPPVPGGIERFLGDLVRAQQMAGDEPAVLCHADAQAAARHDPPWLMRCPVWFSLLFAPVSPAFPFWLARAIRRYEPEVLHLHLPNPSAFAALLLPAARRLPWVVHWHADVETGRFPWSMRLVYPFYRIFERAVLERAEAIVATSSAYLEASLPLQRWRHKTQVIPLGVDPDRLPDVLDAATGGNWRGGGMRVLAIGRLTYYKGFDTLIRAVAQMPEIELVIVGEGEERPRLERLLDGFGRPAHIRLPGQADDATCQRLLASCDVFCLPSRERTEAFGIVLMEAMRYGKPIVASRLTGSGVTWVARENENAGLVPPDDAAALGAALAGLRQDAALCTRFGACGRRRFLAEFDIATAARRLRRLYAKIDPQQDRPGAETARLDRLLVVIPALDEAASITDVVTRVRALGFADVVLIDDGSSDDTARLAAAAGATVLQPPLRQGAWGAMQTGIRHAVREGYAGVVTMDADGQHEPAELARLLQAAEAGADVVIGACPARGSLMRRQAWRYFRFLTGFGFEDLTSGFRFYNRKACYLLAREEATLLDYQDIGVLLLLHRAGLRVREVPVAMNPRQFGASRIFYSWWSVARYMAETTLLCLARWNTKPRKT